MRRTLHFLLVVKRLVLVVLTIILYTNPNYALANSHQIRQPNLLNISSAQGLSQNTINSFYEDNHGFIWLATDTGTNRYDGASMQNLAERYPEYHNTSINNLMLDAENNLWLSTDHGLIFINADQNDDHLSQFPAPLKQRKSANMVIGIEQITNQQYWVFTWNGLYQYNLEGRDISQPSSMKAFKSTDNNLVAYYHDGNHIWLGATNGLYLFDLTQQSLSKMEITEIPDEYEINLLLKVSENQLIVGGNKGLYLVETNTPEQIHAYQLNSQHITGLSKSRTAIYFSTQESIKKINIADISNMTNNKASSLFSLSEVLPEHSTYQITSLLVDSRQLLWIGTQDQGAFIWDTKTQAFDFWESKAELQKEESPILPISHNSIWSIDSDSHNNYWIGTDTGLNSFDPENNIVTSVINVNSAGISATLNSKKLRIYDLLETNRYIWLASTNGLIRYQQKSNDIKPFRPSYIEPDSEFIVYSLISIEPGIFWLATNRGILKFNTEDHKFSYEKNLMSDINAQATQYIGYQNGDLLVGLKDKLILYNIQKKTSTLIFSNHQNTNGDYYQLTDVKTINDQIWLSYKDDGIYVIKVDENNTANQLIHHFHTSKGFPDNNILSLEQSQNFIWATSAKGIVRIQINTMEYRLYDRFDGLISNEFNPRASSTTETGLLLFGGSKGLTILEPDKLILLKSKNPPVITDIVTTSDNESIKNLFWQNSRVFIQNSGDTVYVKYTSLDYSSPKTREFEYWLNNSKEDQVKITRHQEIALINLPVGRNILNIRSRVAGQLSFSDTSQLEIIVRKTEWFTIPKTIGNYLVLLAAILGLLYKRHLATKKTQKLIEKTKESEDRMELALYDDRRGVWECFINPNHRQQSYFIITHNKREPMRLELESYLNMLHPEDVEQATQAWNQFLNGENDTIIQTYRHFFYRHCIWNRISGKIDRYSKNGQPEHAIGTWTKINQEKEIEHKLNLYEHVFQSTRDIVFILDTALNITMVNDAYEKMTGFSLDTIEGKNITKFAFSRFSKKEIDNIHNLVNENKRWHGESTFPRKNAASFPVDILINVIRKNNVETGYVIVMSDTSQHRNPGEKTHITTSFYDQVTGLPNKALAFDRLRQLLVQCENNDQELSIIFLSVDHFKNLESILKSDSIDTLMAKICHRILPYIQKDDVFARYEEDTFVIILRQSNDENNVLHTVNQLLREISKPFVIDEKPVNISACAGISSYPDDSKNWSELVTKAETALAQTKQQGENLFKYYHEDSNKKALERVGIENKLTRAFSEGELYLVYQPLIDLHDMKTVSLDINLRWKTEDERVIYPSQFLHIAEEIGMLKEFSNWLIEKSFSTLSRWNQEGLTICININLPVSYLLEQNAFKHIKEKLDFYNINPKLVFIAIQEDDIGEKMLQLTEVARNLNSLGIKIVLDDFGKTNASILNFQKLNFHTVKFDRSLVRNVGKSKFNDRLLEGIISLINDVNIGSIAKGIETKEQLDFLVANQCQFGQGFLLSDPLNESQVRQYLLNS